MDKTHNISIGGFAFNIEDAAYNLLKIYLHDIRNSINNVNDADEIISDVEFRMAELLGERMMGREVVNQRDITLLIETMGDPQEFSSDAFVEEEQPFSKKSEHKNNFRNKYKKLFRDPDNKVIGGVCAGIGHYIGLDATWVRVITIALLFVDPIFFSMASVIFVGYFILWLVVPVAKTTSDKLQMLGEPVNLDSIRDFFDNSPDNFKTNLNDVGNDARRVASSSSSVIGDLFKLLIKIIGIFFLVILIIVALSLLVAFGAVIVGAGTAVFGAGIASIGLNDYLPYILEFEWQRIIFYVSMFLILVIPAIALILIVLRLISNRYRVPKYIGFGLPMLWLLGIFSLLMLTGLTLRDFNREAVDIRKVDIPTLAKTIIVQLDHDEYGLNTDNILNVRPGFLAFPNADDIRIEKSRTGKNYMDLKFKAKGRTREAASKAILPMDYIYSIEDSLIHLGKYTYLKEGSLWRNNKIKPTLYITDSTQVIFRNIDEVESYYNGNHINVYPDSQNIYTFEDDHLKCINCNDFEEIDTNDVEITIDSLSIHVTDDNINIEATTKNK